MVLRDALERAGNDPDLLLKIAAAAEGQNVDIRIEAARRAVMVKQTSESNLVLGQALKLKADFVKDPEQSELRDQSEKALRAALRLSKAPTPAIYYHLADVLEDRASYVESEPIFTGLST